MPQSRYGIRTQMLLETKIPAFVRADDQIEFVTSGVYGRHAPGFVSRSNYVVGRSSMMLEQVAKSHGLLR